MYVFTQIAPPLLKDTADIRAVPESALQNFIGEATWSDRVERDISTAVIRTLITDSSYVARRIIRWVLVPPQFHFSIDREEEITEHAGYEEEQKSTFESSLNLKVTYGYDAPGPPTFNAEVTANLKITDETRRQWTTSITRVTKRKFLANTTYANWQLLDSIIVTKSSVNSHTFGAPEVRTVQCVDAPIVTKHAVDCVLFNYEDSSPDTDRVTAARYIPAATLALLEKPS